MEYLIRVCRGCENGLYRYYDLRKAARGRDDITVTRVGCLGYCAARRAVDVIAEGNRYSFGSEPSSGTVKPLPRPLTDLVKNIEEYVK